MIKQKTGKCSECEQSAPEQPLIAGKCQRHYWRFRSTKWKKSEPKEIKPIPKFSKKREKENREYTIKRLQFLAQPENLRCPITKEKATDIHHKMGRIGYADEWARQENIPLLLDVRFWLAVSRKGHQMIEENPEWAKENNYSIDRLCSNTKA